MTYATDHNEQAATRSDIPLPSSASPPPEPIQESLLQPAAGAMQTADDPELDEEILSLLGEAPLVKTSLGKNIHKEIASRWQELLSRGLSKEVKDNLCQQYAVPGNCDLLMAPTLNPEAKAALTSFNIKRDHALKDNQQQIGTALSALSQATELLISKETPEKVLKPLSDACRLLCDYHNVQTKTRRNFVISAVKPELKDMLINTSRNEFLFGENLNEQIKTAKNIQKSGEGLKVTPKSNPLDKNKFIKNNNGNTQNKNRLNFKTSYRKAVPGRSDTNRPQQGQRSSRGRPPPTRDQTRERSPPRRSCRK